jgi:hypothetical protein
MTGSQALSGKLPKFGYTERQFAFLRIVALHSGYFLARQYDSYIGAAPGGPRCRLLDQLAAKGHVRELRSCDKTAIYHLCARRFYSTLGIENSRNRRAHAPFVLKTKLMTLDFVLSHPEAQFMTTEGERIELFTDILKLSRTVLPAKFYTSKSRASRTVRYFVDKNPVFLSSAAEDAAPVVSFAYIDSRSETTAGFRSYLAQYRRLLGGLPRFRLVYVANTAKLFEQAGKDFTKLLGLDDSTDRLRSIDPGRLLEHFEARARHERNDYRRFDMTKLNRLSNELREFKGPTFDGLFGIFQNEGAPAVLAELQRLKAARATPNGTFEAQVLPYRYSFLGRV